MAQFTISLDPATTRLYQRVAEAAGKDRKSVV